MSPVNMPEDDSQNILYGDGSAEAEVETPEADLGDETTDEVVEAEEESRVNMPEDPTEFDELDEDPEPEGTEDDDGDVYTITVDGEELEVSLEEALNGYQRQAAFTQKTQELAQEREQLAHMAQLAQALDRDPQGTILSMARNLGVDLSGAATPPAATAPETTNPLSGVDLEDLEPEVVTLFQTLANEISTLRGQVGEVDGWRQAQTEAEFHASIDREAEAVAVRHGVPDLDKGELYRFAAEYNIGDLDAAYVYMRDMKAASAAPPPAVKSKRTKKQALRTEGGRHRNGSKPIARGRMSLMESMEQAARDVGVQFAGD